MSSVVVVDDEMSLAEIVALTLEQAGYETQVAWNGQQGLELVQRRRPDVVITDLMMPVMDGWHLCQRMQSDAQLRDIPVVVMSAAPGHAADRGCRYVALLRKPFELSELLDTVASVLAEG